MEAANGNLAVNHNHTQQHASNKLHRSAFRALVQDFSPTWFTWCMNSGALSGLIYNCPYKFDGMYVIAGILFVTNLVLFIIFSIIFILRLAWLVFSILLQDILAIKILASEIHASPSPATLREMLKIRLLRFRWAAYKEIVSSMAELTFAPCWPIAFMTLTSGVALVVSNSSWGGYPFSIVSFVMFWIVSFWDIIVLLWAFITLIRRHEASDRRIPLSIIIPAVSVATVAITGANVATFAKDLPAKLAVPVMILSFNWVGIGIILGLILYVYLFHALLAQGWPDPDQTPTLFILVGPMGQSAAALQLLGAAATTYHRFGDYNTGTFVTAEAAKGLDSACVLIALLFNGLGVIWFFLGVYAMLERAYQRELRWTPAWNAAIFPNGTLTTSFSIFAIEMDSPAYRVITCVFIVLLVALYLFNLVMTILRISQGKLLIVREDYRVRQQIEDDEKEK